MKLDSKAVASRSPSQRYPGWGKKVSYPGPPPSPHKVLKPHTKEHSDLQVPSLVSCPPLPVLICYPFPPDNSSSDISEKASSRSPPPPPPRGGGGAGRALPLKLGAAGPPASIVFGEGKTVPDLLLAQSLFLLTWLPSAPGVPWSSLLPRRSGAALGCPLPPGQGKAPEALPGLHEEGWGGGASTGRRTRPAGPCQPSCGGTRPAPSASTSILLPPPTGLGAGPGASDVAGGCVGGEGGLWRVPSPAPPSAPQPRAVPISSLILYALPSWGRPPLPSGLRRGRA